MTSCFPPRAVSYTCSDLLGLRHAGLEAPTSSESALGCTGWGGDSPRPADLIRNGAPPAGAGGSRRRRGFLWGRYLIKSLKGTALCVFPQIVTKHTDHEALPCSSHSFKGVWYPDSDESYESHESYESEEPAYNYNYQVKDYYGNNFGHGEQRYGEVTQGSYYNHLPDGRLQTVNYAVDGYSGFLADVNYEGEAHYDSGSYESGEHYRPTYRAGSDESGESYESTSYYRPGYYRPRYSFGSHESGESRFGFGSGESRESGESRFSFGSGESRESGEYYRPRYGAPRYYRPRYSGPRYYRPRYSGPRYYRPRYYRPRYSFGSLESGESRFGFGSDESIEYRFGSGSRESRESGESRFSFGSDESRESGESRFGFGSDESREFGSFYRPRYGGARFSFGSGESGESRFGFGSDESGEYRGYYRPRYSRPRYYRPRYYSRNTRYGQGSRRSYRPRYYRRFRGFGSGESGESYKY
ncbi:Pro-resilin [Portunus trituberculatus]|uniref:Pro-resilin n=1 Tax=Portunus trituberculatus TaxID=210409 RepID=A0A5B7E8C1_PORTR|nr:Pro-resilin [Portunus trituberculatus]